MARHRKVRLTTATPFWKVMIPDIVPVAAVYKDDGENPSGPPVLRPVGRAALVWDEESGAIDAYVVLDADEEDVEVPLSGTVGLDGTKVQQMKGMRFFVGGTVSSVLLATKPGAKGASSHPSRQ